MPNPFSFPDWVPAWAQLLLVIGMVLVGLCFILMPFSVFGLKSRLEVIEARLDEIQGEIRSLALRLPEPQRFAAVEDQEETRLGARPAVRPPVPPANWAPDTGPRRPIGAGVAAATSRPARTEPRLDRYR